jgi:hypothetical protein
MGLAAHIFKSSGRSERRRITKNPFLSPLPGLEFFDHSNPTVVTVGYYRMLLRSFTKFRLCKQT